MSATLASLRSYTQPTAAGLRDVAARQAAALRTVTDRTAGRPATPAKRVAAGAGTPTRRFSYAEADAAVAALPVGRFALPRREASASGNTVTFFKVFETRKGKRIVQLVANGGMDYAEHTLPVNHQVYAARHILEDVTAARQLYGRTTGTCGDCGRALSNAESLAYGIGPVCRNK